MKYPPQYEPRETLLITDSDQEILYGCLAEIGLLWDENGGGWCRWNRFLTGEEWALVLKAEKLAMAEEPSSA